MTTSTDVPPVTFDGFEAVDSDKDDEEEQKPAGITDAVDAAIRSIIEEDVPTPQSNIVTSSDVAKCSNHNDNPTPHRKTPHHRLKTRTTEPSEVVSSTTNADTEVSSTTNPDLPSSSPQTSDERWRHGLVCDKGLQAGSPVRVKHPLYKSYIGHRKNNSGRPRIRPIPEERRKIRAGKVKSATKLTNRTSSHKSGSHRVASKNREAGIRYYDVPRKSYRKPKISTRFGFERRKHLITRKKGYSRVKSVHGDNVKNRSASNEAKKSNEKTTISGKKVLHKGRRKQKIPQKKEDESSSEGAPVKVHLYDMYTESFRLGSDFDDRLHSHVPNLIEQYAKMKPRMLMSDNEDELERLYGGHGSVVRSPHPSEGSIDSLETMDETKYKRLMSSNPSMVLDSLKVMKKKPGRKPKYGKKGDDCYDSASDASIEKIVRCGKNKPQVPKFLCLPPHKSGMFVHRKKKLTHFKSKHKNIIDPVFSSDMAELMYLLNNFSISGSPSIAVDKTDHLVTPAIFRLRKLVKKRKEKKIDIDQSADGEGKEKIVKRKIKKTVQETPKVRIVYKMSSLNNVLTFEPLYFYFSPMFIFTV